MNHKSAAPFESIESAQEYGDGTYTDGSGERTPFDSIENTQEFFDLLAQAVLESQQAIEADIRANLESGSPRRVKALRLLAYKLEKITHHIKATRRILNDLRMLRRLLLSGKQGKW